MLAVRLCPSPTAPASNPPGRVQVALLAEIADAWAYTVRAGMGLFAPFDATHAAQHSSGIGSAAATGPAGSSSGGANGGMHGSDGEEQHGSSASVVDAIHAHHLWIAFLWEVSEQRQHDLSSMKGEAAATLWRLFSAALADAGAALTAHPASTGARFRLLHLALKHCRAQQAQAAARRKPCPLPVLLLFEQVRPGRWASWQCLTPSSTASAASQSVW